MSSYPPNQPLPIIFGTILILFLAAISLGRNLLWSDDILLWSDVTHKSPARERGFANLGIAYMKQNRITEAMEMDLRSLAIAPNAVAHNSLGNVYARLGRDREALEQYNSAIALNPDSAQFYNNRGIIQYRAGRYGSAVLDYTKALSLYPQFAEAYMNRGNALDEQGQLQQAVEDYTRAIDYNPSYADAYYNRSITFTRAGNAVRSRADLDRACSLGSSEACRVLASESTGR